MAEKYPVPRFRFEVRWNEMQINCSEVSGLVMEREKIEYRHGNNPVFGKIAMPGMMKSSNITLKRGKFEDDSTFNDWFKLVTTNRTELRSDVLISLLNESGAVVAMWKALRCFAVKVTAPDLKSDANEVAIESVEIAHEGIEPLRP